MAKLAKLSATGVGRAGEFLAASRFQMAGLETAHVDGSCDLHVTLPSKRVLRVEVKSSIVPTLSGSFKFNRGGSNADIFVFCCIPLSLIRIFSDYQLKGFHDQASAMVLKLSSASPWVAARSTVMQFSAVCSISSLFTFCPPLCACEISCCKHV